MIAHRNLNQADEHLPGSVIVFHLIQGLFQMLMSLKIATELKSLTALSSAGWYVMVRYCSLSSDKRKCRGKT